MMYQIQERDAELRGEKRGELRGISIGEQNASIRIAKQLLLNNLPIDAIAKACDLTVEQVLAMKSQLAPN